MINHISHIHRIKWDQGRRKEERVRTSIVDSSIGFLAAISRG
jgi:hypothetical protein